MRSRSILGLVVLTLGLAVLGGVRPVQAQVPDTQSVVSAYKQAFSSGDLDATFALFADQFAANDPLTGPFSNKADYRHAVEAAFAANPGASIAFGDSVIELDTAVHYSTLSSDPIRAAGISRVQLIQTLVVFQGKIVAISGVFDLADPQTAMFVAASAGR